MRDQRVAVREAVVVEAACILEEESIVMEIQVSYEDWNSVFRGGGKSLCEAPSVGGVNKRLASPLTWTGTGWAGTTEQISALASSLETKGKAILDIYSAASGITARLTIQQAKRMLRIAEMIRTELRTNL